MHSRRFNALRQRRRTTCKRFESRRISPRASSDNALHHGSGELETGVQPYEPQDIYPLTDPAEPASSKPSRSGASDSRWTYARKPSIAAACVLGVIVFLAIIFLVVWYVKRERRRRLRELQNASQDPFCQSTLSLTEDTSKTLDDFLMKEVQPERTSLMFSRSRSPSFTFLVDESDRQSPMHRLYPTSSDTSSKSLSKSGSSARASADTPRPGISAPNLAQTTSNTYHKPPSRASVASVSPSQRSSLWTTTTSSTTDSSANSIAMSPVFSRKDGKSSITSQSGARSINSVTSPSGSLARSGASSASRASSRYSAQRAIDQNATIRRAHNSSHRRSLSTIHSPIDLGLSTTTSGQSTESTQPSNSSSSPLLFRLSVEMPSNEVQ